jgi:hypothetical protein
MTMHNGGSSLPEIRAAIERKYAAGYPTMTPTPRPPEGKGEGGR